MGHGERSFERGLPAGHRLRFGVGVILIGNAHMDLKALQKANARLRTARKHAEAIPEYKLYSDLSDGWSVFLHAAKGIYTALEQGVKNSPQERQWFGAKNRERREDELLRYVTEARNDDEHGIEQVIEYVPGSASLGIASPGSSSFLMDENGNTFVNCGTAIRIDGITSQTRLPKLRSLDGKPVKSVIKQPTARLVEVTDRSGLKYPPPAKHLGQVIPDPTPKIVADLMVSYLEKMVAEAAGFHKPWP